MRGRRAAREAPLALAVWLLLMAPAAAADSPPITDSAGRRVEIPRRVERVYAAGGPASIFLYTLAPERMLGWNRSLTPDERAFVPAPYADLPALGRLTGRGNTANVETVLAVKPDAIIDYGALTATYVSLADRTQQQAGVPYLLLDGGLSALPAVYVLLGVPERGRELARHAERLLAETDRRVARVPVAKRPAVYYARGPKGLETAARGSINVESIERLGARNVAENLGRGGVAAVSPEQVLGTPHGLPEAMETVVLRVRGPRVLAAVAVGATLAAAGSAYQGLFRNPLVSPDILGVSSGAALGATLGIFFS